MQAYGYAVDDWDSEMPMRLREATLTCSIEDLRRIRKFISDVLVEREAAGMVDGRRALPRSGRSMERRRIRPRHRVPEVMRAPPRGHVPSGHFCGDANRVYARSVFLACIPVDDKRVLTLAAKLRDAGLDDTA